MTGSKLTKLDEFITKVMEQLETDLTNLASEDDDLARKKNLTTICNNLVTLIIRLSALRKEEPPAAPLTESDLAIIDRFIEKRMQARRDKEERLLCH